MTEMLSVATATEPRRGLVTEGPDAETQDVARDRAIRRIAVEIHRLNNAVVQAVEAGMTVELVRASRHHCGAGNWGDMMVPVIRD